MREKPILFSAPMVQAILAGTKTQTRRVVKPQPDEDGICKLLNVNRWEDTSGKNYTCPYGVVGSELWVRETHMVNDVRGNKIPQSERTEVEILYKATDMDYLNNCEDTEGLKWAPSIHMPRWASRIQLEITGVRVERLNDISEADAIAEGMSQAVADAIFNVDELTTFAASFLLTPHATNRILFESLWKKINGAGSWAANPWVWVLEFKVLKP